MGCSSEFNDCLNGCEVGATISPKALALVSSDGRKLVVTGTIRCEQGLEIQSLQVTVTQRSGFATVAQGNTKGECTGAAQQFSVQAEIQGSGQFLAPGFSQVCFLARTGIEDLHIDSIQGCNNQVLLLPNSLATAPAP